MRIWLSTAPPAFRLKGAGGGTVDNRNQWQGLHLRNSKSCPNKPGHLSSLGPGLVAGPKSIPLGYS